MKLSQFKFRLPDELIAQRPNPERDQSRLMVVNRRTGEIEHKIFKDIIDYFDDGDLFVYNDTMVFPARLYGNKEKTGARIEVFLLVNSVPKTNSGMCSLSRHVKSVSVINCTLAMMNRWSLK